MNIQPINIYKYTTFAQSEVSFQSRYTQKPIAVNYNNSVYESPDIIRTAKQIFIKQRNELLKTLRDIEVFRSIDFGYKPLERHINYTPAANLKDAKEFARKNFGIEDFEVNDVIYANIINNAMTRVSNFANGNVFMPMHVYYRDIYSMVNGRSTVHKREMILNSLLLCNMEYPQEMEDTIFHEFGHFINEFKRYSILSKSDLVNNITENLKCTILMGGKIIDNYKKILKQEYLESLSIHKKLKILRSLKTKSKKTLFDNETKFLYDKYVALYKQSIEYKDKFAKLLVPELNDKEKEISVLVSDYAAVNQPEFLAEVFKKICRDGLSSVPGNVMNLYQSIGGVILPNFPK